MTVSAAALRPPLLRLHVRHCDGPHRAARELRGDLLRGELCEELHQARRADTDGARGLLHQPRGVCLRLRGKVHRQCHRLPWLHRSRERGRPLLAVQSAVGQVTGPRGGRRLVAEAWDAPRPCEASTASACSSAATSSAAADVHRPNLLQLRSRLEKWRRHHDTAHWQLLRPQARGCVLPARRLDLRN